MKKRRADEEMRELKAELKSAQGDANEAQVGMRMALTEKKAAEDDRDLQGSNAEAKLWPMSTEIDKAKEEEEKVRGELRETEENFVPRAIARATEAKLVSMHTEMNRAKDEERELRGELRTYMSTDRADLIPRAEARGEVADHVGFLKRTCQSEVAAYKEKEEQATAASKRDEAEIKEMRGLEKTMRSEMFEANVMIDSTTMQNAVLMNQLRDVESAVERRMGADQPSGAMMAERISALKREVAAARSETEVARAAGEPGRGSRIWIGRTGFTR